MRLPRSGAREADREPRPLAIRRKDERRNEPHGRGPNRVGRGPVPSGRVRAPFLGARPDPHARPLRRLRTHPRRCRGCREATSVDPRHRIAGSSRVGRHAPGHHPRGPRVCHRGESGRSCRRASRANRPRGRTCVDGARPPEDHVPRVARSPLLGWPLGAGDGRTGGRGQRAVSSGGEIPPGRASRGRHGLARCGGVDAVRLRSRSDAERGVCRDRDTLVDGPACGASRPSVDRGRLELLQPTWAPARRRTGDPRAHRPARSLSETVGCGCGAGELMAKLYTRRGDAGETGLLGPERVSKDDPRIEAMGTVDELNAVIGLAMAVQRERRIRDLQSKIQDDLFTVGAELAISHASERTKVPQITRVHVARLEEAIEAFDVGKITEVILPRGSEPLARLHWARTVARRAERRVVSLSKRDALNPDLLQYMNRLSSLLYQMAVWGQHKQRKKPEHPTYNRQAGTKR